MSEHDHEFDPGEHTAPQVVDHLADADEEEKRRVAAAELAERETARKTVLADAGVDAGVRMDASGRVLSPWESAPKATDA